MTLRRRTALALALTLVASCAGALADTYPSKPIRMVVGFPAGPASDNTARLLALKMSETLKQPIVVDNKPGAAGIISHEAVKNAAPDGYTILLGSSGTFVINPFLYRKIPYDTLKDFEPVGMAVSAPSVLFVPTNSPISSMRELVAMAKSKGGKMTYGSGGSGTTAHIVMEMVKKAGNFDMLHVPYKGSPPMITDVVGGQVDAAFESAASIVPFSKGGRVKLLAVSSAQRLPSIPNFPTVAEEGFPGFEATSWNAMVAPKGTPPAVVSALNAALNQALKDPVVIEELAKAALTPMTGTPADLRRFFEAELAKWGKAVKDSGAVSE
jgi:tripartite-type tricarboxylate transporter receptor subunit TctC